MYKLLYKEFKLAVHPMFLVLSMLCSALVMIPQWVYFLVPLYFCMITVPNLLGQYRANKDNQFTFLLPVSRDDVVKSRIVAFSLLEAIHLGFTAVFLLAHHLVYGGGMNFGFDLNAAYIGLSLVLFGVFNLVLFPLYYRTADAYGLPVILATVTAVLVASAFEAPAMVSRPFAHLMEDVAMVQLLAIPAGLAMFLGLTVLAYRYAVRTFRQVGL